MPDKPKKILIVEDEIPMLKALADKFSQSGFETFKAKNGAEGLATALKEHPDLILLDLIMPKMDGTKVMEKLREDSWGKDVPIIVLTNLNLEEMEILEKSKIPDKVKKGKPLQYLVKTDMKLEDILEKVKKALG
ncbi:MAG: response regulator [Patescibacteria group bacterium]|nr:response regulator [Patescibacteria group bacterium]